MSEGVSEGGREGGREGGSCLFVTTCVWRVLGTVFLRETAFLRKAALS